MIDQHAMRYARAAIMRERFEACETERLHDAHHVLCHHAFAVRRMVHTGVGGGFVAIAITTQIHRDQGEMLGEHWRDTMPNQVRLRMTVQQQERRLAALIRDTSVERDAVGGNAMEGGVCEHAWKCSERTTDFVACCSLTAFGRQRLPGNG